MAYGNVAYSYRNAKGKPVFAPSDDGREIGYRLKEALEAVFEPDAYFFHLRRDGGHVAALHAHRQNRHFARVDLENFFYGVGRNRVARCLRAFGLAKADHFARWSTVKNPYGNPTYSLPYGFVQSPLLATLVLSQSALGAYLRQMSDTVVVSVYVDDIAISSNNKRKLKRAYRKLRKKAIESGFSINRAKSVAPGRTMSLFNCQLTHLQSLVSEARRDEFYSMPRTRGSAESFERYCETVARAS